MGSRTVSDRADMIAGMNPALDPQLWCFVPVMPDTAPQILGSAITTFRETEGVSAIVPSSLASDLGLVGTEFQRITLQVHSDLEGVGLTAAVSTALADAGIACNIVAALHHDHVFVPANHADEALAILRALSEQGTASK